MQRREMNSESKEDSVVNYAPKQRALVKKTFIEQTDRQTERRCPGSSIFSVQDAL